MAETTPQAIARNAPAKHRRMLLLGTDPNLRADLASLSARPRSIRKLNTERASAAVELIEDPDVLAAVHAAERRVKVSRAIEAHPLSTRVSHHLWCTRCREVETGVASVEEFTARTAETLCALTPVRILEMTTDQPAAERCWQLLLEGQDSLTRASARAAVRLKVATGELDRGAGWVSALLDEAVTWRESQVLCNLIPRIRSQSIETVRLWLTANRGLPGGDYDAALLKQLVVEVPDALAGIYGIEQGIFTADDVVELWPHLSLGDKVNAARVLTDDPFLTWALEQLADDPDWQRRAGDGSMDLSQILQTRPDLGTRHRMIALAGAQYDAVVQFAAGDLHATPRPGEVRAAVRQLLDAQKQPTLLVEWAKRYSGRAGTLNTPGMRELAEYLLTNVRASTLLNRDTPLDCWAHDHLWEALATPAQRTTAMGLLGSWEGTIPELIAAVNLLEAVA